PIQEAQTHLCAADQRASECTALRVPCGHKLTSTWWRFRMNTNELPDYHEIIKLPMDFRTLRRKLDGGRYAN
ncbi:bromodomain-containing protein 9-like protein, partial [Tanacetum coccineum]